MSLARSPGSATWRSMWARARRSASFITAGCWKPKWKDSYREKTARRSQAMQPRMAGEAAPPARGDDGVAAREHPRRRALEEVEVADLGLDLGHELDRRGAGADDGDAAAVRSWSWFQRAE